MNYNVVNLKRDNRKTLQYIHILLLLVAFYCTTYAMEDGTTNSSLVVLRKDLLTKAQVDALKALKKQGDTMFKQCMYQDFTSDAPANAAMPYLTIFKQLFSEEKTVGIAMIHLMGNIQKMKELSEKVKSFTPAKYRTIQLNKLARDLKSVNGIFKLKEYGIKIYYASDIIAAYKKNILINYEELKQVGDFCLNSIRKNNSSAIRDRIVDWIYSSGINF